MSDNNNANNNIGDGGGGRSENDEVQKSVNKILHFTAESRFENAVETIKTFYQDFYSKPDVEVDEVYVEMMQSVEERLIKIMKERAMKAVKDDDVKESIRMLSLLGGLGQNTDEYFLRIIHSEAEKIMEKVAIYMTKKQKNPNEETWDEVDHDSVLDFVSALRRLYEFIVVIISNISKYWTSTMLTETSAKVINLCDTYAPKILDLFLVFFKVPDMIPVLMQQNLSPRQLRLKHQQEQQRNALLPQTPNQNNNNNNQSQKQTPQTPNNNKLNEETVANEFVKQLTEILEQMSLLSQCNTLFDTFVEEKLSKVVESKRHRCVKEILSYYNIMEEHFMKQQATKAIVLDERPENEKKSTVVDAIFFVLKQSAHRALSTDNCNSSCSLVMMGTNILNIEYKQFLASTLHDSFFGDNPRLGPLTALNNVSVSVKYTNKLRENLENESKELFGNRKGEFEKIRTCLHEFKSVSISLTEVQTKYMNELVSRLHPRISSLLMDLEKATYELDEESYQANEINDPYVVVLFSSTTELLHERYKSNVTKNNYALLVELVLDFVSSEIEKRLRSKIFSLFGSIQLEKELTYLIDHFSQDCKKSVRSKFGRLSQIASVLSVEKVNHIVEVWTSTEIQWKLTAQEIKWWLRKRKDLPSDEIEKLHLEEKK